MLSTKKDEAYLKHILDAIADIQRFVEDLTEEEFIENKEKQYAVQRALEIIGEATKNVSKETKAKHSSINWRDIAGTRDKLIHGYFGVNLSLIWETIQINLPELKKQIQKILSANEIN